MACERFTTTLPDGTRVFGIACSRGPRRTAPDEEELARAAAALVGVRARAAPEDLPGPYEPSSPPLPREPGCDDGDEPAAPRPAPRHAPKRCRSCGAAIYWARSEAGRPMPVDAEPTPDGRVVLWDRGGSVLARTLKDSEQLRLGEKGRRPHHMTCPDAASWRQPRLKGT